MAAVRDERGRFVRKGGSGAVRAKDFKDNLRGIGRHWRETAKLIVDGVTFKLYANVVEAQVEIGAVDTGRSVAGWAISIYTPGSFVPEDGKEKYDLPSVDRFVADVHAAPLEAKRFIYDNVHYTVFIVDGTEKMEGRDFVTIAIQRLKAGKRVN